ncbi:DNA repair protein RecO [Beijerinckiaceae bacterium RH AL1]|nr:DNA repair protein RecO [Beijerinckiaceae bacterium RH CH11]VVB46250.1 DNA repair protein RecO [Beijerinckiaceae bacterium RH AL8]VVC55236.1 DNA repair protein RecO [Beijerinckiaceae bacterium RH AL1]
MPLGMEWRDEGLIIGGRRHGESSVILEVMTRGHGRHLGLVRGGRSKRMAPLLQPGNEVEVTWRARLDEHLGYYAVETTHQRAAALMERPASLHGLNFLGELMRQLAEREPSEPLFEAALTIVALLEEPQVAAPHFVLLEAAILAESGFGLDLDSCAATGARDDLVYVSPKSGRAVSRGAGTPYHDRMLALPAFLRTGEAEAAAADVGAGFLLTGYFLDRDLYAPHGKTLPASREAFIASLAR